MDREDALIFIIIGALGLTQLAEWFLLNVLTPIGDIVNILNWMSTLNDATPFSLIISLIMLMVPIVIISLMFGVIKEKFNI